MGRDVITNLTALLLANSMIVACGSTNSVPVSGGINVGGTATVAITVTLGVLDQLTALCTADVANIQFPTDGDKQHAISECVFNHLNNIGTSTSALTDFANTYCGANVTPQTAAACTAIGK